MATFIVDISESFGTFNLATTYFFLTFSLLPSEQFRSLNGTQLTNKRKIMPVQSDAIAQLGALPFGNIIGGPLVAAIEAQSKAAKSTVDFINAVAFAPPPANVATGAIVEKKLQTVEFKYKNGNKEVSLIVPLLTIVPIPYIRIDDMTIQFKANISAETTTEDKSSESTSTDTTANVHAEGGFLWASVDANFTASYSAKKDSSSAANSKYAVEYTMDVYVHAVQDDMPAGMQKVLNILNDSIQLPPPATPKA